MTEKMSIKAVAIPAGVVVVPVSTTQARGVLLALEHEADLVFSKVELKGALDWCRIEIRGRPEATAEDVVRSVLEIVSKIEQSFPACKDKVRAHLMGGLAQLVVGPAEPDHIEVPE